ncbi:LysR family transcriptional regulator [Alkalibaculum sp. M08DMB]|uniref:LysR family transcriptional regulator n=1 Tax=Alkalibaculum sporogenes TaxID=2655001 RepID=A0A6A7K967_9FIRM|nr:LysR family transcriptional regulator [Alkalibaculum sporogenes]MPW25737.1 LysR family transcriptional regulator [Alkalibaculum sporogenes]
MDFNQLRYFLALTKYKYFTETANELHLSQSSLSKQIKALEKELNYKLIERTMKGCELTEEGIIFKKFALDIMKRHNILVNKLEEVSSKSSNTINIGTMPIMSEYKICDEISCFMSEHLNYNINIIELPNVQDLVKLMENGELNLVFIGERLLNKEEFLEIPLIKDRLVFIVSSKSELSKFDKISLSKIKFETLILLDKITGLTDFLLPYLRSAPKIMSGYTNSNTILSLVRDNVGVSIIWKNLLNGVDLKDLKVINIEEDLSGHIVLGIPKGRNISTAEVDFKNYIEKRFSNKLVSNGSHENYFNNI